ncbi:hypothetical protein B0H19DRAFT_1064326 [Mycena capillaripes]|nr:hypothetical protein B0H19DRAFT_1064326 [Mycena capillaripes]
MANQMGDIILLNVYILPESSDWVGELDRDPCQALASAIALAHAGGFRLLISGDLNAPTRQHTPSVHDPPRSSKDNKLSSPKSKLCNDYDLVFISGADCFGRKVANTHPSKGLEEPAAKASRKRKREEINLTDDTELDKVLIQTLNAGKDEEGRKNFFYMAQYTSMSHRHKQWSARADLVGLL